MFIKHLELVGYKRLLTANIRRLVYTPHSVYQLILGSNGSGKSSVLAELSPLPGHSANYTKDGSKTVVIEHRGSEYTLISTFKSGNKHTFIKDGEVLNKEGTAMVQKELVLKHFNYWGELHDLLTGRIRFTQMAPLKRREWMTRLSKVDYRYPLKKYQEFKTAHRDSGAVLRDTNQRLTQETQNLKALNDLAGLDERAHLLRHELTALLTARTPNLPHYEQLRRQIDDTLATVDELSREITTLVVAPPAGAVYRGMEDVRQHVSQVEGEVNTTQTLLNHYTREYSDIESILNALAGDGVAHPENLEGLMIELEQEASLLEGQFELFRELSDPLQLKRDSDQVLDQVIDLFNQLPDNTDRRYSRDRAQQAKLELGTRQSQIDQLNNGLVKIRNRLNVINTAKDLNCPNCGYVWREGYSEQEVAQLERWQQEHVEQLEQIEVETKRLTTYLEEMDQYMGQYSRFRGYVSGYPRLSPLWDLLLEKNYLSDDPRSHMDVFYIWQRDVERSIRRDELNAKMLHIEQLVQRQGSGEGGHFNQRLIKLGMEIEETTGRLQTLRGESKSLRSYYERIQRLEDKAQRLHHRLEDLNRLTGQTVDAYRNYEIDQVVVTDQNELALIQRQITERSSLEGVVNMLARTSEDVELDNKAFELLTRAISPTEGLIAEQLSGSIGCQVAQWNAIIASIWNYDLQILPCSLEDGELDYKFPVHAGASNGGSDDIGNTSRGQEEVINFAFVLTAMLYQDMQDYPLFLDEFGSGFDEQHRTNAISFIKQLIDTNHHSQLFMISHYIGTHGGLANPEVLVLDGANIAVPSNYNQHVVLE